MDLTEKLNLVGYFEGESKQLKSVEEVADFICKNGKHGDVIINHSNKIFGRSVYLCYNNSCIEAAFKKNRISKALKTSVPEDLKGRLINEF